MEPRSDLPVLVAMVRWIEAMRQFNPHVAKPDVSRFVARLQKAESKRLVPVILGSRKGRTKTSRELAHAVWVLALGAKGEELSPIQL